MMHGCQLVMAQGWTRKLGTVFKSLSQECQLELGSTRLNKLPVIDATHIQAAKASLEKLERLCRSRLEKLLFRNLHNAVYALDRSAREGKLSLLPNTSANAR